MGLWVVVDLMGKIVISVWPRPKLNKKQTFRSQPDDAKCLLCYLCTTWIKFWFLHDQNLTSCFTYQKEIKIKIIASKQLFQSLQKIIITVAKFQPLTLSVLDESADEGMTPFCINCWCYTWTVSVLFVTNMILWKGH